MADSKLLSIQGLAAIKRNHRETGAAIEAIIAYINRQPAPPQKQVRGAK